MSGTMLYNGDRLFRDADLDDVEPDARAAGVWHFVGRLSERRWMATPATRFDGNVRC